MTEGNALYYGDVAMPRKLVTRGLIPPAIVQAALAVVLVSACAAGFGRDAAIARAMAVVGPTATGVISVTSGPWREVVPQSSRRADDGRMVWAIQIQSEVAVSCPYTPERVTCPNDLTSQLVVLDYASGDELLVIATEAGRDEIRPP